MAKSTDIVVAKPVSFSDEYRRFAKQRRVFGASAKKIVKLGFATPDQVERAISKYHELAHHIAILDVKDTSQTPEERELVAHELRLAQKELQTHQKDLQTWKAQFEDYKKHHHLPERAAKRLQKPVTKRTASRFTPFFYPARKKPHYALVQASPALVLLILMSVSHMATGAMWSIFSMCLSWFIMGPELFRKSYLFATDDEDKKHLRQKSSQGLLFSEMRRDKRITDEECNIYWRNQNYIQKEREKIASLLGKVGANSQSAYRLDDEVIDKLIARDRDLVELDKQMKQDLSDRYRGISRRKTTSQAEAALALACRRQAARETEAVTEK